MTFKEKIHALGIIRYEGTTQHGPEWVLPCGTHIDKRDIIGILDLPLEDIPRELARDESGKDWVSMPWKVSCSPRSSYYISAMDTLMKRLELGI